LIETSLPFFFIIKQCFLTWAWGFQMALR